MQTPSPDHICKNCGNQFSGKFCNQCGEKVYTDKDRSVLHFMEEGFHFLTHFDGNFFTTLKSIFVRPGQLSVDYAQGIRKKYFKPLSLFLVLVVLYLLFPFLKGLNMDFEAHFGQRFYGDFAYKKAADFLSVHQGMTMDQLATMFEAKSEKTSKFLLLILLPLGALPLWLLGRKKRPYFFDSLIFSTEFNNLFLLVGFFIIPLFLISLAKLGVRLPLTAIQSDQWVGILEYAILTLYLRRGIKRLYNMNVWMTLLTMTTFILWHIFSVFILYKYLLFVIVFLQLH